MPRNEPASPSQPQDGEKGLLTSLVLLALPWLSLAQQVLRILKKALEERQRGAADQDKDDLVNAIKRVMAAEVHALMMIFDQSRTLRSLIDAETEKKLVDEFSAAVESLATGSTHLIEAQEKILSRIIEILKKAKSGQPKRI